MFAFSCMVVPPLQFFLWLFHGHPARRAGSFLLGKFLVCALELTSSTAFVSVPWIHPWPYLHSFFCLHLFYLLTGLTGWIPDLVHSLLCLPLLLDLSPARAGQTPCAEPLLALSSMSLREGPKPLLLPDRQMFFKVAGIAAACAECGRNVWALTWARLTKGAFMWFRHLNFQMALGKCPGAHLHLKRGDVVSESSRVLDIYRK